ncbi:VOC family protein [Actinospongicola halichondriae]|uniref:VOC family protein n=1 Tax=Actinospongicola halichondriae TaxID=3236844 RepID=UPI003D4EEF9E
MWKSRSSMTTPLDPRPGPLDLGVFSLSLAVADLEVSAAFYQKLGFVEVGGSRDDDYLILKNGQTTLGLFHGMFESNILTFNPGLTPQMDQLDEFTDVREIQRRLQSAGIELIEVVESEAGAGHVTIVDPDGNPILIDQFF